MKVEEMMVAISSLPIPIGIRTGAITASESCRGLNQPERFGKNGTASKPSVWRSGKNNTAHRRAIRKLVNVA